ncbi:hypothetical protein AAIH08_34270, partial [Pseudomonas aeruginosa]
SNRSNPLGEDFDYRKEFSKLDYYGLKKEIYQLINQFKADGLSIILVSSEMPEVLGMSDRIIVMHEGHLSGEFTREQATQEVLMSAAVGKHKRVNQE